MSVCAFKTLSVYRNSSKGLFSSFSLPQLANPTHGAALDLAAGFASIVLANYSTGGEEQGDVRGRVSLTLVSPEEEAGLRPRLAFRYV